MPDELSRDQRERYRRHLVFSEIGEAGQRRLLSSSALIIGAGGLGSPAALYLTSCGVGRIGLVDSDDLELSNLHRQVLYAVEDIGKPKVTSAYGRLSSLNPDVRVKTYNIRLEPGNIEGIVKDYGVVLDCTDNFSSKYLSNDTCVRLGKPLVMGGIYRFEGQATVILPGKGPCYRCIFPEPPAPGTMLPPEEAGLLGSVPGVIGAIQATEALKLLAGIGEPLSGKLLRYDARTCGFSVLRFKMNEHCTSCGRR
ncbi:MAG: HesA/MoeB/ThiF family protein [Candidatus Omnitrophica bacterium]|nr:HesA/MoeB/ThiF family protein [Candidatus Omnitrophota bacterium]